MSSLMQFSGRTSKRGVHLEFYQTSESEESHLKGSETCGDYTDVICLPGGKVLPRIWTAVRKPVDMCGCWVAFNWNGKQIVPDLSCPFAKFDRPRDARPMSIKESLRRWNS